MKKSIKDFNNNYYGLNFYNFYIKLNNKIFI